MIRSVSDVDNNNTVGSGTRHSYRNGEPSRFSRSGGAGCT
ncbi:hypothetical protein I552_4221 [Mycobacterium xenopi 3993]|nr:hypothetical protein I552_4221 [Mycobacterium xenopi 3993]